MSMTALPGLHRVERGGDDFPQRGALGEHGGRPRLPYHAAAVLGAYGFGYELVDGRHQLSAQLGNVSSARRRGRRRHDDRSRHLRPHRYRRRDENRRLGDGRPQLPHRPPQHALLASGHRRQHHDRRLRGHGRTGGVRDHVHIGNRAVLGAMAGITNDVPDGSRMIGIPATPEREQKIKQAIMSRLPGMRQQLKRCRPPSISSRKTPLPRKKRVSWQGGSASEPHHRGSWWGSLRSTHPPLSSCHWYDCCLHCLNSATCYYAWG